LGDFCRAFCVKIKAFFQKKTNETMKPTFLLTAIWLTIATQITAQNWLSAKRYSAPSGSLLTNEALAYAPDSSIYLVGTLRGTVTFDALTATAPANATQGYLLKLNPNLQAQWVKIFPEIPYNVTSDASGNAFVVGSEWASSADSLTYVAKYDASGTLLATFRSTGSADSWGKVARTDAAGNCYITGERFSAGTMSLGATTLPTASSRNCFLAKLSPDLSQVLWAVYTGESSNLDNVYDLEVDASGNVYTSGNYSQNYNIFCPCYNGSFYAEKRNGSNGALLWKKIFSSGSGGGTKQLLAADPSGQAVYVGTSFKNTTNLGDGFSFTAEAGTNDYHILAAKLNAADGTVQWAKKISLTGHAFPWGLIYNGGKLQMNGSLASTTLIGTQVFTPQGGNDPFFLEISPSNGDVLSAQAFAGAASDLGFGLDGRAGVTAVSGTSQSASISIGDFDLTGNFNSVFVAKTTPTVTFPPLTVSAQAGGIICAGTNSGTVTATITSGTPPYTFAWSNDGTTAMLSNLAAGTYTVTVTDGSAQTTASATVTQSLSIELVFDIVSQTGCANAAPNGQIAPTAVGGGALPYAYLWSNGATVGNLVGLAAGTYTATVTNADGCTRSFSVSVTAQLTAAPTAAFSSSTDNLNVSFTNTSANATSYSWNFGDGQSSSEPAPTHTYANAGTYTVTLTATNNCGTNTTTQTVTVADCQLPQADFSANLTTICVGEAVQFSSNSANANALMWAFPGATPMMSSDLNPMVVYALPGLYAVVLNAINECGNDQITKMDYIRVLGSPTALFEAEADGLAVTFSNGSLEATTYVWDFGDGQSSSEPAPMHTYATAGTYTVRLTATNNCGTSILELNINVTTVGTDAPAWLESFQVYPNPNAGLFSVELRGDWAGQVEVSIFGPAGQMLQNQSFEIKNSHFRQDFDLQDLPTGIYLLRMQAGREVFTRKVFVAR
jgi:PKD repeat protein